MDFKGLSLPSGMHVRPSASSDQQFLNSLYQSTRDDLNLIDGESDFIVHLKESQLEAQTIGYEDSFPDAMHFVIEYHTERVGRIVLNFETSEIRIVDISLIPAARGKGLGSGIIRAFIHCAEQVMAPLKLSVLSHNVQARQLYAQLGFVVEDVVPPREFMAYYPSSMGVRVGV